MPKPTGSHTNAKVGQSELSLCLHFILALQFLYSLSLTASRWVAGMSATTRASDLPWSGLVNININPGKTCLH